MRETSGRAPPDQHATRTAECAKAERESVRAPPCQTPRRLENPAHSRQQRDRPRAAHRTTSPRTRRRLQDERRRPSSWPLDVVRLIGSVSKPAGRTCRGRATIESRFAVGLASCGGCQMFLRKPQCAGGFPAERDGANGKGIFLEYVARSPSDPCVDTYQTRGTPSTAARHPVQVPGA